MGYFKKQRTGNGRFGRTIMRCDKCGTVIKIGDFFYSKATKRRVAKNSVKHICEKCYEK